MIVYLASKNAGKAREIATMLAASHLELREYVDYRDPEEGHESYVDNALLKARTLRGQLRSAGIDAAVLADDSGIELDALGGAPGVDSAMYAGAHTAWPQRLATMLDALRDVPEPLRGARFVCVMAFIDANGVETVVRGDVEGVIATKLRGASGFGYDPIFVYPPLGKTFGELPDAQKNHLSHRGRAARALLDALS